MTRTDPFYMSTYSCCLFTRSIAQSIGTWSGRPGLVPGPHSATSACVRDLRSKRTRLIISIALRTNMLRQPRCKRIHKLAETVADQVRSAQVVPTPAQALEEVVANSVDAKATRIDIEIDSVSFNIRVTDNGCGIPQSCFPSLALRHATSKHLAKSCDHSSHTLGFKGEALASIAENSVLHISSKAAGTFETHEKLLRGGKLVKQGLTADQRQSTGTVVWMQDFLYNQPVRRRQLEQSGIQKELENCRERVMRIALARPDIAFCMNAVRPQKQLLHLLKGRTTDQVLSLVFGELITSVQSVCYTSGAYMLQGFITLPPAGFRHKLKQYLYINSRYVQSGQAGKLINKLQHSILLRLQESTSLTHPKQSLKQPLLYPAFALQLSCPNDCFSISSEIDKSCVEFSDWATVLSVFQTAVVQAWHTVAPSKVMSDSIQDVNSASTGATALSSSQPKPAKPQQHDHSASFSTLLHSARPTIHGHEHASTDDSFMTEADADLDRLFRPVPPYQYVKSTAGLPFQYAAHPDEHPAALTAGAKHDDTLPSTSAAKFGNGFSLQPRLQSSNKVRFPIAHSAQQICPGSPPAIPDAAATHRVEFHCEQRPLLAEPRCQAVSSTAVQAGRQEHDAAAASPGPCPGCNLQRSYSGPPFCNSRRRSAHTNPLYSLHTDWHRRPHQSKVTGLDAQPKLVFTADPHLSKPTHVSQRHALTVSGVCGQLRPDSGNQHSKPFAKGSMQHAGQTYDQATKQVLADITNTCAHQASTDTSCQAVQQGAQAPCIIRQQSAAESNSTAQKIGKASSRKRVRFSMLPSVALPMAMQQHSSSTCSTEYQPAVLHCTSAEAAFQQEPFGSGTVTTEQLDDLSHEDEQDTKHHSIGLSAEALPSAQTAPNLDASSTADVMFVPNPSASHAVPDSIPKAAGRSAVQPSAQELLLSWVNPCLQATASSNIANLPSLCGAAARCIMPTAIRRSDLQQGIAMRQLENKFIALVCNGVLCIADQHAADERVQLEKLKSAVLTCQDSSVSAAHAVPVRIELSRYEMQLLTTYKSKVERWGWRWHQTELDTSCVLLTASGCVLGTCMGATDLQVYLHQLGDTGGSCVLPPAVVRVLNSKACRSAIMFGDPLLPTECAELIAALKITQLCFCCAHGRPTMAPLINIAAYEQHLATAHGLQAPHNLSMLPVKWKDGLKQKLQLLVSKSP